MNKLFYPLISLSICFIISCSPRVVPYEYPKPFEFTLIDTIKGSQSEIYVKANQWMAKRFVSSKAVIQMADKEAGKLIGKAIFIVALQSYEAEVPYTISIDVKEGRYRCILSDFNHEGGYTSKGEKIVSLGPLNRQTVHVNGFDMTNYLYRIKNSATDKSKALLADLKTFMRAKESEF